MGTFQFFMVIIIILCILLTLVVLSQNPKGGGLSSSFGGSGGSQMFGVQRTNKFLDGTTWGLFLVIIVLVISSNIMQENPKAMKPMKASSSIPAPAENSIPAATLPETK